MVFVWSVVAVLGLFALVIVVLFALLIVLFAPLSVLLTVLSASLVSAVTWPKHSDSSICEIACLWLC